MPELIPAEPGSPDWQPHIQRGGQTKFCGHVHFDAFTGGWVVDCHSLAAFIRTATDGAHEYACGKHVQEMSQDA